jgi:hypothetical protein
VGRSESQSLAKLQVHEESLPAMPVPLFSRVQNKNNITRVPLATGNIRSHLGLDGVLACSTAQRGKDRNSHCAWVFAPWRNAAGRRGCAAACGCGVPCSVLLDRLLRSQLFGVFGCKSLYVGRICFVDSARSTVSSAPNRSVVPPWSTEPLHCVRLKQHLVTAAITKYLIRYRRFDATLRRNLMQCLVL